MLSACFLYFNLISATGLAWPDPYIGLGVGLYTNFRYSKEGAGVVAAKDRDSYVSFGVPFRVFASSDSGWNSVDYIFTPELGFTSSIVQFNLLFGSELEKSMGYRNKLSAIVFGLQGGMHYASLVSPENPVKSDGTELSEFDKNSLAFMLSGSFGPKFFLTDRLAFRFLINPRIMLGQIAQRTFSTVDYPWLGYAVNFNFQVEFSQLLRDPY